MNPTASTQAPRAFPILLALIAAPMIVGGIQLVFLGGSFYYLLAGLVLAASAMRLWQANPIGSLIYAGLLIATVAWALMESGTNLWALAPRILPFSVIGLWLLTPWQRRSLYQGEPPALFCSDVSKGSVVVALLLTIFVVYSGSGCTPSALVGHNWPIA
jgi:glucose dehydrogenase